MADSTSNLDPIVAGANAATRVNETLDAASPATLYGRRASTTTGLTWGYYGGSYAGATLANGTVALTANATNYIVALRTTGAVSASTSVTNFNDTANYWRLYQVVAGASTVTSYVDRRQVFGTVPKANSVTALELGGPYTTSSVSVPVKLGTLTATITTAGNPVLVLFKCIVQKSAAGSNAAIAVRRNGVPIGLDFIIPGPDADFHRLTGSIVDTPPAGTWNYEFFWNVETAAESLSTVTNADPRFERFISAKELFV